VAPQLGAESTFVDGDCHGRWKRSWGSRKAREVRSEARGFACACLWPCANGSPGLCVLKQKTQIQNAASQAPSGIGKGQEWVGVADKSTVTLRLVLKVIKSGLGKPNLIMQIGTASSMAHGPCRRPLPVSSPAPSFGEGNGHLPIPYACL
jgi:hypothetical protein